MTDKNQKLKLLLVGNHTCANRGDAAILRGLIDCIERQLPNAELTVLSRFPEASSFLLGRKVIADPLYIEEISGSFYNKLKRYFYNKILFDFLLRLVKGNKLFSFITFFKTYRSTLSLIKQHDKLVQVGGSFFVDLYGEKQFSHALLGLLAKKPIYMLGHSVGPFDNPAFADVSSFVFSNVNSLILREQESLKLMEKSNIKFKNLTISSDTAWLVNTDVKCNLPFVPGNKPKVAITVRELKPFESRLGVTQQEYEAKFISIANQLIERGYLIIGVSMCTGIGGYSKDDHKVANNIKRQLDNPEAMFVYDEELNDLQIGKILADCELTIGTRLHSNIISMRFGTPSIAVYYEHKSQGTMEDLGYQERSVKIQQLDSQGFWEVVNDILEKQEKYQNELSLKIEKIAADIETKVTDSLSNIGNRK